MNSLKRYLIISLGCLLFAVGFAFFLDPADIAPGGVSGIAILLTHFFPDWDSGTIILLLNLPLLVAGALALGGEFLFGTVWATLLSSFAVSALESLFPQPLSPDRWFCAVSGAVFCGVGVALVYRRNATTGGTDIAVRLLQRKFPALKPGYLFIFVDSCVVAASGAVFRDFQTLYYSAFSLILSMLLFNGVLYPSARFRRGQSRSSR